eukprot:2165908-Pleurochrysis_carterae.AAC.2
MHTSGSAICLQLQNASDFALRHDAALTLWPRAPAAVAPTEHVAEEHAAGNARADYNAGLH